jgi:hypothetical protein
MSRDPQFSPIAAAQMRHKRVNNLIKCILRSARRISRYVEQMSSVRAARASLNLGRSAVFHRHSCALRPCEAR